jgi:hypothetical protein
MNAGYKCFNAETFCKQNMPRNVMALMLARGPQVPSEVHVNACYRMIAAIQDCSHICLKTCRHKLFCVGTKGIAMLPFHVFATITPACLLACCCSCSGVSGQPEL